MPKKTSFKPSSFGPCLRHTAVEFKDGRRIEIHEAESSILLAMRPAPKAPFKILPFSKEAAQIVLAALWHLLPAEPFPTLKFHPACPPQVAKASKPKATLKPKAKKKK